MLTQDRSPFISSCTRRELHRRRPGRVMLRIQLTLAALAVAAVAGALIAVRGGL